MSSALRPACQSGAGSEGGELLHAHEFLSRTGSVPVGAVLPGSELLQGREAE